MVAESAANLRAGEDSGGEDIFDVFVMSILNKDDDKEDGSYSSDDDAPPPPPPPPPPLVGSNGSSIDALIDTDQLGLKQVRTLWSKYC